MIRDIISFLYTFKHFFLRIYACTKQSFHISHLLDYFREGSVSRLLIFDSGLTAKSARGDSTQLFLRLSHYS